MPHRRFPAAGCLLAGLLVGALALFLWSVEATALDRGRVAGAARALLHERPVEQALADRMATAVALHLPSTTPLDPASLDRAALAAVHSAPFEHAFADGLHAVYDHVVHGTQGPIPLDAAAMAAAAREGVASVNPALAATMTQDTPIQISVPTTDLPDLHTAADLVRALARILTPLAIVMIGVGFALHPQKPAALSRVGRWAIALGAWLLVDFWVLPSLVLEPMKGWIAVSGVVVGTGDFLRGPALALIAFGVAAILGGARWASHDRHRTLAFIPHAPGRHAGPARWESPV